MQVILERDWEEETPLQTIFFSTKGFFFFFIKFYLRAQEMVKVKFLVP